MKKNTKKVIAVRITRKAIRLEQGNWEAYLPELVLFEMPGLSVKQAEANKR